jgi:hypothetical protein
MMLFHTIALIQSGAASFHGALVAACEKDDSFMIAQAIHELADKHFNYYSVFCNHQEQAMADIHRLQQAKSNSFFNQVELMMIVD